jgi:hypothetical protein
MGKLITTYTTYQATAFVASVAAGAPICQINTIQNVSTRPRNLGLVRLRVVLTNAVKGEFGLVIADPFTTSVPTAPGTSLGQPVSSGNGGYGQSPGRLLSLWTTPPVIPGTPHYLELDLLPASTGAKFEWTWPDDDPLTVSMHQEGGFVEKGIVLQNLNAGASPDMLVTARWIDFSSAI